MPAMIPDLDIYHSDQVLVKQHGEDAPIQAVMRADALLAAGDVDGYAVWGKVRPRIYLRYNRPDLIAHEIRHLQEGHFH